MEVVDREICRYNLRGICRFGQRCWNLHEIPSRSFEKAGGSGTGSTGNLDSNNEQVPSTSTVSNVISAVKTKDDDEENEKTCGICFDTVLKKVNRNDQMFGLLPNCSHCFCYSCIIRWRQTKEFDYEVSKSCPECRTASDFVYQSKVWMNQSEEKTLFIESKKQQLKKMHCKYFKRGKAHCPFGNKCLYLHALWDGTVVDVGEPKRRRKRVDLLESNLMAQLIIRLHVHAENDDELDLDILDLLDADHLYHHYLDDDFDEDDDEYDYDFDDDFDYDDLPFAM